MKKPPAILLFGPTATGKTDLACALCDSLPLEIVSVDSALVFKSMNIGTAKPSPEILKKYPHHLIDCILPTETFSAARFQKEALVLMQDISARGNIPFLVGGTMLYFATLLEGISDLPSGDSAIRQQIDEEAQKIGWAAMHEKLKIIDAETAARLKPLDSQRIQRALEVFYLSGRPLSFWFKQPKKPLPFLTLNLALLPENRADLHAKIATRFKAMLDDGLVDEVKNLRQNFALTAQMPSMRSVGYRQVWQFLEGEIAESELCDRGIFATRQLAKRQITWIQNRLPHESLCAYDSQLFEKTRSKIKAFLKSAVD